MKELLRLWRGELPLETAFWNWAVVGGLFINIVSSVLFLMLIVVDLPIAALLVGYSFSVPYNVVATVGVWRSAARYTVDRQRAEMARIVTVVGMIVLSVT